MRDPYASIELSFRVLLIAVPAITLLGASVAYLLSRKRFRGGTLIETAILLPLVLPPSVIGYILLRVLGRGGPVYEWFGVNLIFTWQAAAIASTVVGIPLMVQAARVGFDGVDRSLEDAARDLGSREWRVFLRITLPLARRGVLAGILLGAARALGEFGATLMIAGNIPGRTQTMPLAVFDAVQLSDYRTANVLMAIMVAVGWLTVAATAGYRRHA